MTVDYKKLYMELLDAVVVAQDIMDDPNFVVTNAISASAALTGAVNRNQSKIQKSKEDKAQEVFFYTTDTPHQWSSGKNVHESDVMNGYAPIPDLERAKELALSHQVGRAGEKNYVRVTWGVKHEHSNS